MRANLGMRRHSKDKDPKLAMLRKSSTMAATTHNISGRKKSPKSGAKPVTLPKFKFSDSPQE